MSLSADIDTIPLFAYAVLSILGRASFLCIVGSHVFFNLKEAAEHGVNIGTNWSSYSHSAIRFEEPETSEQQTEYVKSAFFAGRP